MIIDIVYAYKAIVMSINFHLASSSRYRQALLSKLISSFESFAPDIDETPHGNETPIALVQRLSLTKALAGHCDDRDSIYIGSDQVAVHNNTIIGKPLTHDNAIAQLQRFSGQTVQFITGLCVHQPNVKTITTYDKVTVYFRELTTAQIDAYLKRDKPYDCAGSFKCEGLGITLFEKIECDDPNTLIGLPLMRLTQILHEDFGYCVITA